MGIGSLMIEFILTSNYWAKEWILFKSFSSQSMWETAKASTTLRIQMMVMNICTHSLKLLMHIKLSLALISQILKLLMNFWFLFQKDGSFFLLFKKNQVLIMESWISTILFKNSKLINKNGWVSLKIMKSQLSNLENLKKLVFTYIHLSLDLMN